MAVQFATFTTFQDLFEAVFQCSNVVAPVKRFRQIDAVYFNQYRARADTPFTGDDHGSDHDCMQLVRIFLEIRIIDLFARATAH